MKVGRLANRYARAILNAAGDEQNKVANELLAFADVWENQPELSSAILNPGYVFEQRKNALLEIAEKCGFSEMTKKIIDLIFEHGRILQLTEIAQATKLLAEERAKIVRVEIETAREIKADEKNDYETRLKEKISGQLFFDWSINKELLAGIVVKYNGRVFDGSVRGKLQKLTEQVNA